MDEKNSADRRESLSISAILNEESVEPKAPLLDKIADKKRKRYTWPSYSTNFPHPSGGPPLSEEPMNMIPAPASLKLPPQYIASHLQQSKSSSNQILVPEEATVRQLPDGFVVCGITKGKRKRISPEQLKALLDVFQQTDTPSSELREKLAEDLNMSKREVQVWFQNRRAKASRMKSGSQDPSDRNIKHRRKSTTHSSFAIPNTFVPPPFPANPALISEHRPRRYSAVPVLQTVARPFTNIQSLRPFQTAQGSPPSATMNWQQEMTSLPASGSGGTNAFHHIAPKPNFWSTAQDNVNIPPRPGPLHSGMDQLRITETSSQSKVYTNSPIHVLASAAEFVSTKEAVHN
jgi:hypothetical protein